MKIHLAVKMSLILVFLWARLSFAQEIAPIPVISCTDFSEPFDPAYLTNGFIGTRPGPNPLAPDRFTMVSGFLRDWDWEPFEGAGKAPYPFAVDIVAGNTSMHDNPDKVEILSQTLRMDRAELITHMKYYLSTDAWYDIKVLQFIPRTLPTVTCQQVYIQTNHDTGFEVHARIPQGLIEQRNKLGVAVGPHPVQGFSLKPGETAHYTLFAAMVSEFYHPDPYLQAKRVLGWARMLGFEKLREQNKQAWDELWKGRPKVYGDTSVQPYLDAAFFYVQASCSPYCLTSVGPYGFSHETFYGHAFWDTDHWVLHALLTTNPQAARAILEYRFNGIDQARKKALTFGFKGLMFPWEGAVDGSEATPSDANTGWAEHHVIPGVALAFWEAALSFADPDFTQTRAWPVLEGCAEWIVSRGEFTKRGFEIKNILGVDEKVPNIDNNAHMNIMCKMAVDSAIQCAKKVGKKPPAVWRDVVDKMYIPIHPDENVIIPYDGVEVQPKAKGYSIGSAQFLVFHDPPIQRDLFERTFLYEENLREMMEPASNCPCSKGAVGFPCPTLATCAAMFKDRRKAADLFTIATEGYILNPYMTSKEYPFSTAGNFLTNQGSQLQAVLYGFTGLRIVAGNWARYPATLPAGWDRIEIDRLWIKGKPMKLVAEHGRKPRLTPVQ